MSSLISPNKISKQALRSHVLRMNNWSDDHDKDEVDGEVVKESNRIRGTIDYIHHVEPMLAKKLYFEFGKHQRDDVQLWMKKIGVEPNESIYTIRELVHYLKRNPDLEK